MDVELHSFPHDVRLPSLLLINIYGSSMQNKHVRTTWCELILISFSLIILKLFINLCKCSKSTLHFVGQWPQIIHTGVSPK